MLMKYDHVGNVIMGVGRDIVPEINVEENCLQNRLHAEPGVYIPKTVYAALRKDLPAEEVLRFIDEFMKRADKYSEEICDYFEHVQHRENSMRRESKKLTKGHIYFVVSDSGVKIGLSGEGNVENRVLSYNSLPINIKRIDILDVEMHVEAEKRLHIKFASKRKKGEWFDITEEEIAEAKRLLFEKHNAAIHGD